MADVDPVRPVSADRMTGPLRTTELIRDRAVQAVLSQSGLNHPALAAEVRRRFGSTDVDAGALVREPLIEGAAPFVSSGRTFADCAGAPLHPAVIRAIASEQAGDYRFAGEAQPYRHQVEAWEHLTAPDRRSVLVSSGTGSGKTECFLMPLLSDLAGEAERSGKLSGVRALMLYPLNALIASQEERLRAWCAPFADRLRFGLYNGMTPEKANRHSAPAPEQVRDRETLRRDPPPILVTNVTMLEYMTVRRVDRPLIENSRGTLRWIILDEAHGYVGSAAAEIALLIRRVLLTFGVRPQDVRFVATSATIGDPLGGKDVTDELRRFLRDLSGADEDQVKVVLGAREQVILPPPVSSPLLTAELLGDRDAVAANPAVQAFIRAAETRPMALAEVRAVLAPTGVSTEDAVGAVAADGDAQRGPLLPLRIHGFLRAVPGLWSCLNSDCGDAPAGWAFGAIAAERIDACPNCRSPVFEVKLCRECGEPYLECEERNGHLHTVTTPPEVDEFAVSAHEVPDDGDGEQDDDDATLKEVYDPAKLAIASRALPGWPLVAIDPTTGRRPDKSEPGMRTMPIHLPDGCGACGASAKDGSILRAFRYGAPFLIGNAAPVLLEGLPPRPADPAASYRPPIDGRQLLSFTDSRQGTARFAASLQTTAERNFVRGFVYHAVQGSMTAAAGDDPAIVALRAEIAQLEAIAAPTLAELIAGKQDALVKATTPSVDGLRWPELRRALAAAPEIHHWMTKVWAPRDERFSKSAEAFAEFLLLREFNRRPRRGNTAETMGLARLRFDAIDHATKVPEPLVARGFGVADWQGLLLSMLDMTVRGRFAIRASWDDLHWLHTQKPITTLLAPGEQVQSSHESTWPMAGAKPGTPSNLVLILEKTLGLDRSDAQDRARINAVLEAAWQRLMPLLSSRTEPGYALDFDDARIAPVTQAWLCPVSGRVLPATALGRTQYGHRERLRTANLPPQPLVFPRLPVTFPRGPEIETIRRWLDDDQVQALRFQGVWSNLHDRVALLSPYLRAAEHSAQQPPARLRGFEAAFKRGEINILNCSTTMEMGVDIGSVSAVMMTNVPPALANYRQRVGRAGRRRQGFASSLTYTRSTPLDREAFHDPLVYLARQTRVPQVRLDSRRIVQRHVNALLLARWFAGAGGEAMKTRVGDFFGCPPVLGAQVDPGAPIHMCFAWLDAPSTHDAMGSELAALTRGTALAGDRTMFEAATSALTAARDAVVREWQALQQQAEGAPPEGRKSVEYQLKRLALDNLLKELAQRGVLPGHGFPTGVVPFVNADSPAADERAADDDDSSRRRRSFPTRTLDIAIRDYAPGAEVVVDGLVYRSAGVTLNWQRPADDVAAREVQNIKLFWTCPACGAADTAHSAPEHCPTCHADVPPDAQRRFLEPAGFTADMRAKPHADTDEVTYVEPERERIVARGAAWTPMANPTQGRMRASNEGLVFYSSRGPSKQGYHVCLECGRAEPAGQSDAPLAGHQPLRFTKKDGSGLCPGNGKPFKITRAIALGYESVTDVIEIQPVGLESEGVAWAVISALREALVRRLGVEPGELGMAVRSATTPLGQRTHSLFLYDRASGGAGFAPQAAGLYDALLADAGTILDCRQPGCTSGCSACVLTADLHKQQEIIDRIGALGWVKGARAALASVAEVDRAAPDAQLARAVSDEIAAAVERGVRAVTIWASADSDVAALGEGSFPTLVRHIGDRGARVTLVVDPVWLASLDPAARLALRDAAVSLALDLRQGTAPGFANGARMVAATASGAATLWASRDGTAATLGIGWGQGASAPVVRIAAGKPVLATTVGLDTLLPVSGTRFLELRAEVDGTIAGFGERLLARLLPAIRAAGGTTRLERITYADRYLQSPLVLRLMTEALAALRDQLAAPDAALPLAIVTNAFRPNDRQPSAPDHDWQWEDDRREVLLALLEARGFSVDLAERGAAHGRTITLAFAGGTIVRVVLDQGFGPWRTPRYAKFDFGDAVDRQITKIAAYSAMIEARGASYVVVTG